ncbi:type I restriction-modification system subunit M [Mycoplasmopsis columboralis]|uniref:site-specific DNA-methyltransferase (adenine-specific) n=1 Tax=Mycoplasmopsis columboralis TaxID=171282 RepID=A0A449B7K7_9BACT|nr:type I restriction-modification system subunit M [Mycoplasmopsis columboralis]VEU76581.1 Probable type I restriction enzyme BthVORF4518P M protein [Mycoplasmopsis columboralis]
MDKKRETERAELHKSIWKIAEDLRGSVDGWDFKTYVLGFMFYRYISENITNWVNQKQHESGEEGFDYKKLDDSKIDDNVVEAIVTGIGYFIKPSELFANMRLNAPQNKDLNTDLQRVFNDIEKSTTGTQSEGDFAGLFNDLDFDSNKLGKSVEERNKNLVKLLESIGDINLGDFQDSSVDVFGDAYEFLMNMYASSAGKSGGEFFTPPEVSELLTKIAINNKKEVNKVYDPTCGSGSLLLKTIKYLGKDNIKDGFYGQEKNITTFNLCRMNMFLHNISYDKFKIKNGDTLLEPMHLEEQPFDVIVSNPPYSLKWEGDSNPTLIQDERFTPAGVLAPKSKADFAFVMHSLHHLAENGVAAIVCFPGIFYRSGAEQKIRKYLVDNNFIDALIQLPDNLFYGTSIATTILVLKKNRKTNDILFIDATNEYIKAGKGNKLSADNIEKLSNVYFERKDVDHLAKVVSYEQIKENDYKLSVSSYVEKEDTTEVIDIKELNAKIKEITARQDELRKEIDRIIAEIEKDEI